MSLNHHIMAKETTDAILLKFKTGEWKCAGALGTEFYRGGTNADFPSPDAAFYDDVNKVKVSFEFKPPTETKRGILTGLGQSIAYLQNCNISFLVAPKKLDDYRLGDFLANLYTDQIKGKIPTGLILYDNSNSEKIELIHNVDEFQSKEYKPSVSSNLFWAKYIDQPLPLFHMILHYYYLKKIGVLSENDDPFSICWKERLIPNDILETLTPKPAIDLEGKPFKTMGGTKYATYLEKIINKPKGKNLDELRQKIAHEIDTDFTGDNYFNAVKKNIITFHKHLQTIDSEGQLTEKGLMLYNIGIVNGSTSKIFQDYVAKEILVTGHHIDLLLDYDAMRQTMIESANNSLQVLASLEADYEKKGYLKHNQNRKSNTNNKDKFLKDEKILWKRLGFINEKDVIQWKQIIEICSLPD